MKNETMVYPETSCELDLFNRIPGSVSLGTTYGQGQLVLSFRKSKCTLSIQTTSGQDSMGSILGNYPINILFTVGTCELGSRFP